MIIGSVKEVKKYENRVGLTPDNCSEYIRHGHNVIVQSNLGIGSGFSDEQYLSAGASVVSEREEVWAKGDMIIKVKEPMKEEYPLLKKDQIIFTYLHLAANKPLASAMLKSKCIGVAYETLTDSYGNLPLLRPMSEIAGRLSIIEGAKCLEKLSGGKGKLISGVPGVRKAKVVILGGGVAGTNAIQMAIGLGADVTVLDIDIARMSNLDLIFGGRINTIYSTKSSIEREISDADLIIGAVLIPGAKTPKLIMHNQLRLMQKGTVLVDIAIDQGGCFETSHPTYHDDPTFTVEGIVHYCVANIPGAVPMTSTLALTNATLKYGLKIADSGLELAAKDDPGIFSAINIYKGYCTQQNAAEALELQFKPLRID